MKFLMFVAAAGTLACGSVGQSPEPAQPPKAVAPKDADGQDAKAADAARAATAEELRAVLRTLYGASETFLGTAKSSLPIVNAAIAKAGVASDPEEAKKLADLSIKAGEIGKEILRQVGLMGKAMDAIEEARVDLRRGVITREEALRIVETSTEPLRAAAASNALMFEELVAIANKVGRSIDLPSGPR